MEANGGRSKNAWEVERMRHQLSSADGEPSSSGRAEPEEFASGERHLRSVALLPRSSRNGTEPLSLQPTEDLALKDEPAVSPRGGDLRARPPMSLERGASTASSGRRARRGSIADFLGIGNASRDASVAPSREITLQGMGATPTAGRRTRRASVMQSLGFGFGAPAPGPEADPGAPPDPSAGPPELSLGPRVHMETRSKSMGNIPQGRRRRASMLDLFRPSHTQETTGDEAGTEDEGPRAPRLLRSKSSIKNRRASVIDFFRSSNTGMAGAEEAVGSASMGRSRGLRPDGNMSARSNRRRSVIDILGHSSKKVFAKLMNQDFEDPLDAEDEAEEGRLWFTSLADFKPLTFKYLTGRYSSAFFACSMKTGEHYILKQFEKAKMSTADERGVKRALSFAHDLEHEHIVQCCGTWEDELALYIVEEYAIKGDLLQDSMSHPEKYTEAFMANKVVKPLLEVLVYLHSINVIHRAIFPEYVLFGREDKLKLGHFTSAIDQRLDTPNERIPFLDYMAPEMLSVRVDDTTLWAPGWTPGNIPGSRTKAPSLQQTKVIQMQGSNDGSVLQALRSGPPSTHPHSPASPVPIGSPFGRRSPLMSPVGQGTRRQISGGDDIPGMAGFLLNPDRDLQEKAAPSRSSTRSALNPFRSARRLSPQQLPDDDSPLSREISSAAGGGGGPRRARSSFVAGDMADAPWLLPVDGSVRGGSPAGPPPSMLPPRRRKSALEEMSAPWLRPLEPERSDNGGGGGGDATDGDGSPARGATRDGGGGGSGGGAGSVTAPATPPSPSGRMAGGNGAGSGRFCTLAPAAAADRDDGDGSGGAGGPRESSSLQPMSPPTSCPVLQLDGAHLETSAGEVMIPGITGGGAAGGGGGGAGAGEWLRPPNAEVGESPYRSSPQPQPASLVRSGSRASVTGGDGPLAATPPRPVSSRRPGSALHPGSPFRPDSAASSPPPPPQDQDQCLPGYAADPPARTPPAHQSSGLRRQSSLMRPAGRSGAGTPTPAPTPPSPLVRQPSGLQTQSSGSLLRHQTSTRLQTMPSGPLRRQASGLSGAEAAAAAAALGPPGPVMESLVLDAPPTPTSTLDTPEFAEVKRTRTGVSFTTTGTTPGEESTAGANADDRPSRTGAATRGSRVTSREASTTAGSNGGGQVILGLRNMARNITMRLGQVLGSRGVDGPAGQGGETPNVEGPEGAGGGWGEPTPRQSFAGAGGGFGTVGGAGMAAPDAMALTVPNNPWEWQEAYNEKVDLWQVGCLVHEILCSSLPFEADDKMLACALILWADIVTFPDHLSPECHDFIRSCLTKNPAERPSASDLLQHPWIARHAAGEVLKSVKQLKDDETSASTAHSQQITTVQRAAAALGLGWLAGVGAGGNAGAGGAGSSPRRWGWAWSSWWGGGSKVAPSGPPAVVAGKDQGEAKFEMARALVHEQQAAEARRRSQDVETGAVAALEAIRRRSLEPQGQYHQTSRLAGGGAGPGGNR